ncbi:sigma-70 family RNA polymerase sigma factor [Kitasatospora viridis]|uniref:DNA-directed RNA polymerase specialized sigma24 family protein n=1 Tax=Kitasatospora viridis TaxID=281105 RepID=A0A561TW60_9ACTN|nr:sigma-70 family RNA polymerase sigma factor [Kitasatospora viridis]TWF91341.1 hypothetical protein FHX73_12453 [Kitasatospora viridis]
MDVRSTSRKPVEPLQLVEQELRLLVERPVPLTLYVADLDGSLPDGWLDMASLRALLLHPSVGFATRGAIWVRLLTLTRAGGRAGEEWCTATCAMALPGLWRIAGRLRREVPELAVELQQVMLCGFWDALVRLREQAPTMEQPGRIPASLCWAADRAARSFRNREAEHGRRSSALGDGAAQQGTALNPETVLELAVAAGVLSREAADLIAATRLDGVPVRVLAERAGCTPESLGMRRRRAEVRLIEALRGGRLDCTPTADLMTQR